MQLWIIKTLLLYKQYQNLLSNLINFILIKLKILKVQKINNFFFIFYKLKSIEKLIYNLI